MRTVRYVHKIDKEFSPSEKIAEQLLIKVLYDVLHLRDGWLFCNRFSICIWWLQIMHRGYHR